MEWQNGNERHGRCLQKLDYETVKARFPTFEFFQRAQVEAILSLQLGPGLDVLSEH